MTKRTVFIPESRVYASHTCNGMFEIVSLVGTIAEMDGQPYAHVHIAIAGSDNNVLRGHLLRCVISADGELVLQLLQKLVHRKYDKDQGYSLFDLL